MPCNNSLPFRTPVSVSETVLYPVQPIPTQPLTADQDPWLVVANRGVTTPGAIVRQIELDSPTAATEMRITISAQDVLEPICGATINAAISGTIAGQPRTISVTSGLQPLTNGHYTIVSLLLPAQINFSNPGSGTTAHIVTRLTPAQVFAT